MNFDIKISEDNCMYPKIIVNQFENEIDQFEFTFPFPDFAYVAVLKSPKMKKLELPIIDNKLIISNKITSIAGEWSLIIAGTKEDALFVSDEIKFLCDKNFLNMKTTQEVDENIELLYSEIEETLQKLDDTGLDDISSVVQELEEINKKIDEIPKNDYTEDLQEIKGFLVGADNIANTILGGV